MRSVPASNIDYPSALEYGPNSLAQKTSHRHQVENRQAYDTNPLYAIMHESIYLSGVGVEGPSSWAAQRVLAEDEDVSWDWLTAGAGRFTA